MDYCCPRSRSHSIISLSLHFGGSRSSLSKAPARQGSGIFPSRLIPTIEIPLGHKKMTEKSTETETEKLSELELKSVHGKGKAVGTRTESPMTENGDFPNGKLRTLGKSDDP